jgi:hypothetical protein
MSRSVLAIQKMLLVVGLSAGRLSNGVAARFNGATGRVNPA